MFIPKQSLYFATMACSKSVSSDDVIPFLKYKKLSPNAILSRASPLSAGYNLFSVKETKVPKHGKAVIPTALSIAIPEGTYAHIVPRSDLNSNHSIHVGAGVVDADYRGEIRVVLFNHSETEDFNVNVNDHIAQMILKPIVTPDENEIFKLHSCNAVLPSRGSPLSAGYDVSSSSVVEIVVPARGKAVIETDISVSVPIGTYGRIAPRSGLASKHSISISDDDIIHPDNQKPIKVVLHNHSDKDFKVNHKDRIAQLVFERIVTPDELDIEKLVKKLSPNGILPTRTSVGYNLFSAVEAMVRGNGEAVISSDLSISVPKGTYGRITAGSGQVLELEHSISVREGVIDDANHHGPVIAVLRNFSNKPFIVKHNNPIGQVIVQLIMTPDEMEVEELDETRRGECGFGSTGF